MHELDAVEFVELLAGLSAESRFHGHLSDKGRHTSERPDPATVPAMTRLPRTHNNREDYLRAMRQHRGRVVDLRDGGAR